MVIVFLVIVAKFLILDSNLINVLVVVKGNYAKTTNNFLKFCPRSHFF